MPNSPPFSLSKILAKKDVESKYGRQHHSMFPSALTKAAVRQLPITPYDIFFIIFSSFARVITYYFVIESFKYYTINIFSMIYYSCKDPAWTTTCFFWYIINKTYAWR